MNPLFEAIGRTRDTGERAQQERAQQRVRLDAFAKANAELYLERVSDDTALVRLSIGHMSFGIGQPRNGSEAASVLRTFRDALTDLLVAAKASEVMVTATMLECIRAEVARIRDGVGLGGFAENAQFERGIVGPYLDAVSDALDELEHGKTEQRAWQPIETAPEDTNILVATQGGWVDTAFWTDEDGEGRKWWWLISPTKYEPHPIHPSLMPTHWMLLPAHPEKQQLDDSKDAA